MDQAGRGWDPCPFHVGFSGWRYPPWRGDFYPPGLAQQGELEYASRSLASVEGQRLVLRAPDADLLQEVAWADAARLRLLSQGPSVCDTYEET